MKLHISTAAMLLFALASCQPKNSKTKENDNLKSDNTNQVQAPNNQDASNDANTFLMPDTAAMRKYTKVAIVTNLGTLEVALFDATPKHRDNFLKLVRNRFYEGTLFHRIIKEFMVQGGDPESKGAKQDKMLGQGGPGYNLDAEISDTLYHFKGALAAARQGDEVNPEKKSSGSQFYIVTGKPVSTSEIMDILHQKTLMKFMQNPENTTYQMRYQIAMQRQDGPALQGLQAEVEQKLKPMVEESFAMIPQRVKQIYATWGGSPFLDQDYTVFGFVIKGYDVLNAMQTAKTSEGDRPLNDIRILSMRVLP